MFKTRIENNSQYQGGVVVRGFCEMKIICDDDPQKHHHQTPELLKRSQLGLLVIKEKCYNVSASFPGTGGPENITSV